MNTTGIVHDALRGQAREELAQHKERVADALQGLVTTIDKLPTVLLADSAPQVRPVLRAPTHGARAARSRARAFAGARAQLRRTRAADIGRHKGPAVAGGGDPQNQGGARAAPRAASAERHGDARALQRTTPCTRRHLRRRRGPPASRAQILGQLPADLSAYDSLVDELQQRWAAPSGALHSVRVAHVAPHGAPAVYSCAAAALMHGTHVGLPE
jgi:hypothetical protein